MYYEARSQLHTFEKRSKCQKSSNPVYRNPLFVVNFHKYYRVLLVLVLVVVWVSFVVVVVVLVDWFLVRQGLFNV